MKLEDSNYLTVKEAAEYLRVTERSIIVSAPAVACRR